MMKRTLGVLLGLLAVASVARAQEIVLPSVLSFNDKVLVNRGGQYLPFTAETALQAGDKLMVLDGGELTLGCPGEPLVTFKTTGAYDLPTCKQAVAAAPPPAPVVPVPATGGATTATSGAATGGVSGTTIALGAAAAAVVVGVAASGGGGDDGGSNPPVSP